MEWHKRLLSSSRASTTTLQIHDGKQQNKLQCYDRRKTRLLYVGFALQSDYRFGDVTDNSTPSIGYQITFLSYLEDLDVADDIVLCSDTYTSTHEGRRPMSAHTHNK